MRSFAFEVQFQKFNIHAFVSFVSSSAHGWQFCGIFFTLFYIVYREALADIFDRCDLDGNGYLSREEFDFFQMKSGGEQCDDDAWEIMKGN